MPLGAGASSSCCTATYGIGPTRSIAGGPNARSGASAASPSSTGPTYRRSTPTTGWPRTGSGTNSSGGAQMNASPLPISSGASAMKSR